MTSGGPPPRIAWAYRLTLLGGGLLAGGLVTGVVALLHAELEGIRWAGWHPAAWAFLGGSAGIVLVLAAVLLAGEGRWWETVRSLDRRRRRIQRAKNERAARRASRDPEVGWLFTLLVAVGLVAGFVLDRQPPPHPHGNPVLAIVLGTTYLWTGIGILTRSRRHAGKGGR